MCQMPDSSVPPASARSARSRHGYDSVHPVLLGLHAMELLETTEIAMVVVGCFC